MSSQPVIGHSSKAAQCERRAQARGQRHIGSDRRRRALTDGNSDALEREFAVSRSHVLQTNHDAIGALALLWLGFAAARWRWGAELTAMLDGAPAVFLSPATSALLLLGGIVLGAAGGALAARHAA